MSLPTSTFKIFVAEDDEDDLYLLQQAFTWHAPDCTLVCVTNGEQLLQELQTASPLPQLVLLDLNMPLLDGIQTLGILRSQPRYGNVPVVILSTCDEKPTIERCPSLGASAYRVKPTLFNELVDLVLHLRFYWLAGITSWEHESKTIQ